MQRNNNYSGEKKMSRLHLLITLALVCFQWGCSQRKTFTVKDCTEEWAVAKGACPVLNTPDYHRVFGGRNGHTLKRDKVDLVREIELVALPGTIFKVHGICNIGRTPEGQDINIYKVDTDSYPYESSKGYYVDGRFLRTSIVEPLPPLPEALPSPAMFRYKLLSMVNSTYLWGGNYYQGIPEMASYYPSSKPLFGDERKGWLFRGVDCSGLLFEVAKGQTPRNASSLIRFGEPVEIEGHTAEEIAAATKPFDLLGWRTHVMIVLDKDNIIQSRVDYDYDTPGNQSGVRVLPMVPLIKKLMESYVPVDSYDTDVPEDMNKFVIRRWYDDARAKSAGVNR